MKNFKNKTSKYGYYFGKFCLYTGVLLMLVSLFITCNDNGNIAINVYGLLTMFTGFGLFRYGYYRIGGIF